MAMAEVYYPDAVSTPVDDSSLVSFPRAPPPSPEMQPRGLSRIFEIPPSKLEGIGLDLRRDTFPFEEESGGETCHYPVQRKPLFQDSDPYDYEDEYIAYSPRKRVCCASSVALPENHTITTFPSSCGTSSLASSGFGSFRDVSRDSIPAGGVSFDMAVPNGTQEPAMASAHLSVGPGVPSKPHLIPPRPDGGAVVMRDPFSPSYHLEEECAQNVLSRSLDLHAAHPHLPHSFETTQLPSVRPGRSRTLDTASLQKTLTPSPEISPENNLNAGPRRRRRKISVKRKNPDESENDSLQFSFDYSYSSTGSSGENDWVLVDRQPEGIFPMEKKPCSDNHSSILAHTKPQPYLFNGNSLLGNPRQAPAAPPPLDVPRSITISPSFSPFFSVDIQAQHEGAVSKDSTPTQQRLAMDLGMDVAGCSEDMEVDTAMGTSNMHVVAGSFQQGSTTTISPLVLRPHPLESQEVGPGGNSHAPGLLSIPSRHSCMEGFLHQQSNGDHVQMDTEAEARMNLSKSL